MKFKNLLTGKEKKLLADLLNEQAADLRKEYDNRILSIQKKLGLYPRKERWVLCGIQYATVIPKKGATMMWEGPIVKCCDKAERPYSEHNLLKKGF